jgi:hypothetical protein
MPKQQIDKAFIHSVFLHKYVREALKRRATTVAHAPHGIFSKI